MNIFRYRDDPTSASIAYLGVALLVGALVFILVGPKPSTAGMAVTNRKAQAKINREIGEARQKTAESENFARRVGWNMEPQRVTPLTVQTVTSLARQNGVQLMGVRPQRVDAKALPNQLPFVITVSGGYPGVVAFTRQLEKSQNKLVITSVQITSADANTNLVTATVGALGYIIPPARSLPLGASRMMSGRKLSRTGSLAAANLIE